MPKSINGNTPAPHPHSDTHQAITLSLEAIRQLDGLYCLNDLHRLSGGEKKNTPSRFIHLDKTQSLINALQDIETQKITHDPKNGLAHFSSMGTDDRNPKKGCEQVFKVINGGEFHGIYGNRKIVYAYANWIDPYFYAAVLEVFDRVTQHASTYTAKINQLVSELNAITHCLSTAGRILAVEGKQTKPAMQQALNELLDNQQMTLEYHA